MGRLLIGACPACEEWLCRLLWSLPAPNGRRSGGPPAPRADPPETLFALLPFGADMQEVSVITRTYDDEARELLRGFGMPMKTESDEKDD